MPRPLIERHILHDFAITANQTMRRNAQMSNLGKERMRVRIQVPVNSASIHGPPNSPVAG